uniref:Uncharacterized protein n=1 Tax=Arundo donax TaxID=35708 RepID=A0A0A9HCV6_ARUDO
MLHLEAKLCFVMCIDFLS